MLTIRNTHNLINQRINWGTETYYVLNTWAWNQEGNEQYHFHLRHITKTHSDIKIVLNRFKTDGGYILWNENDGMNNCMLVRSEQIKSKKTFLYCIERVMITK
jgi:hypothetical protein